MDLDDPVTMAVDFASIPAADHAAEISRLCDAMDAAAAAGRYPLLAVERPWSADNPRIEGEFASPGGDPLVPGTGTGPAGGRRRPDIRVKRPEGR